MLFNSAEFLFFFPIVLLFYFITPIRLRTWVLLGASVLFYMSFVPKFILIIGALIIVDFFCALWIEGVEGRKRKFALIVSLFCNLAVLIHFKFTALIFNFAVNLLQPGEPGIKALEIVLPLGISFHTFQSLSYIFDVYLGHVKAERKFHLFALYVLFFPQMVAGPIERAAGLLAQLQNPLSMSTQGFKVGIVWIVIGYFKKVVIADRMELVVGPVFDGPFSKTLVESVIAIFLYPIQLYCDFSGYTDIGVGLALFLGISLRKNFAQPLLAVSVSDYWKRWNISLSTWFRDYLFGYLISLRGSIFSHVAVATLIVFALSGLWHGSGWGYLIWGCINGIYILAWLYTAKPRMFLRSKIGNGIWTFLGWILTTVLIALSLVFFRASEWNFAVKILSNLIPTIANPSLWSGEIPTVEVYLCLFLASFALLVQYWGRQEGTVARLAKLPGWLQIFSLSGAIIIIFLASLITEGKRFIYYQF